MSGTPTFAAHSVLQAGQLMNEFLERVKDPEVLEVIEGLLNLCMEREREIADLVVEVERLKGADGALGDRFIVAEPMRGANGRRDVLVADGVDLSRRELADLLVKNGYEVVATAKDGEEAVQLYEEKRPALVTMDTHMPMLDGYQATRRIRELDPRAKVIVVSRVRDRNMVLEALRSGASDYVTKPIQPQRLLASVSRLLAS